MKHHFLWGVAAGVLGTWAYHAFLRPLPGGGKSAG